MLLDVPTIRAVPHSPRIKAWVSVLGLSHRHWHFPLTIASDLGEGTFCLNEIAQVWATRFKATGNAARTR